MKTHKIIIVWHVKTSQCKKTATQYPHHQNVWKKSPNRLLEPQGKYILIVYLLFVCFVLLVFCVIITSASVAPFSVGYSKTYIGLEAQFRSTFQPVHKSYFEVFTGEIPREEAVRRDFISSVPQGCPLRPRHQTLS